MKTKFFSMALSFPCFRHMANRELSVIDTSVIDIKDISASYNNGVDPLTAIIFANDPVTGIPQSDLAMIMAKDTSPEISQYIRDNLLKPLPTSESTDNPNEAISFMRHKGEDLMSYSERLRTMVTESNESNSD